MNQPILLTNALLVACTLVVAGCRHNDGLDPNEPAVVPWADAGKSDPPSLPPMPGDESPTASLAGAVPPDVGSASEPVSANAATGAGGRIIGMPGAGGVTGGVGGATGKLPPSAPRADHP